MPETHTQEEVASTVKGGPTSEVEPDWKVIDIYSPEGHFLRRMSREEYEEVAEISAALHELLARGCREMEVAVRAVGDPSGL